MFNWCQIDLYVVIDQTTQGAPGRDWHVLLKNAKSPIWPARPPVGGCQLASACQATRHVDSILPRPGHHLVALQVNSTPPAALLPPVTFPLVQVAINHLLSMLPMYSGVCWKEGTIKLSAWVNR